MSKKLLEESTIRSFMKLANLQPLSDKFIKESWKQEESLNEEDLEEGDKLEEKEGDPEDRKRGPGVKGDTPYTANEAKVEEGETLEEVVEEAGEVKEEGKESEGRPASKKQAPKGTSLAGKTPAKMAAAKNAAGDAKLKPAQKSSHHSDKPDSIETKTKSNASKKDNSTFEVVSESLQEEMEDEEVESPDMGGEAPGAGAEMGSAGESGEHQGKMKDLIRGMLDTLKDMGAEYGMSMEISDEGAAGGEEMAPPEGEVPLSAPGGEEEGEEEAMMQEKLDEMVEKLTKRVAARLVKESKKKR